MSHPLLLTPDSALTYLREHALIDSAPAVATELGGGVSNIVIKVTPRDTPSLIIKQSLPKLRVAADWQAPVSRIISEGRALTLAHELSAESVPAVRKIDEEQHVLVTDAAPDNWLDWKHYLLDGETFTPPARRLGTIIGTVHRATRTGKNLNSGFFQTEAFEMLRLDPYFEATARAVPELADDIRHQAQSVRERPSVLIHGDLSPKNVLVSPPEERSRAWLIDFEVACYGDPTFDVAFLLSHLMLKSIHLPSHARECDSLIETFSEAYAAAAGPELRPDWSKVNPLVGALMMARVYGKSPVEYLSAYAQSVADRVGRALLTNKTSTLNDLKHYRESHTS